MEALELKAEPRTVEGRRVKQLRQQGFVPAVMYGRDVESTSLQINVKLLTKVLNVAGSHQLISLQIGNADPRLTLAREIQRDHIKHIYTHVDFYAVKMDEKVTAQVPIVIIGHSPAVQDLGGILTQGLDELEIECLPSDLVASIEINIDSLTELNDTLTVSDLTVPDMITILSDSDSMVVKIEPPRIIEEEEEEEEELLPISVEPEVLTASRRDEEE